MNDRRGVRVPLWALGAGVCALGFLLGVVVVLLMRPSGSGTEDIGLPVSSSSPTPTPTTSTVTSPAPLTSPTPASSPSAAAVDAPNVSTTAAQGEETPKPEEAAEPSPVLSPNGGLRVLSAGDGPFYGQGSPSGSCANWTIGLVNQSDTPITDVTFAPPDGSYTNYSGWDGSKFPEIEAEPPEPTTIAIYLAPGDSQDVEFQTCTSSEPPSDPEFEFGATAPEVVTFRWATGDEGSACFTC